MQSGRAKGIVITENERIKGFIAEETANTGNNKKTLNEDKSRNEEEKTYFQTVEKTIKVKVTLHLRKVNRF